MKYPLQSHVNSVYLKYCQNISMTSYVHLSHTADDLYKSHQRK